ncbi:trehalose-phosphatase [Siccirubricoccus phaeus]|uniref:trehalose-phosphatase n=1 Tax=Siccirubricoccus phaeus TaxID=2595053 RepID=UPI001F2AFB12|nr:trehalose-phosphatase [Siccirubricoccus phaeus]
MGPFHRPALFLDFDGTLVEIAERPDAIRVPEDLPKLLHRLAAALDGALAIVSGRPLGDLIHYLPVPLPLAGEHGAALRPVPEEPPLRPDLPQPPAAWRARADALVAEYPGTLLEPKAHGFVLHYRQAPEAGAPAHALMASLVAEDPAAFTLLEAHMAWEIRPRGPSKASAVRALMAAPPFAGRTPLFIGDDVTDEEGMRACRELGGQGWRLQEAFGTPAELRRWLARALNPHEVPPSLEVTP